MRRKRAAKREKTADPIYNSLLVATVISKIMQQGKRSVAEKIVYGMIDELGKKTGKPGLEVFNDALNNIKPVMEVKSRRVVVRTIKFLLRFVLSVPKLWPCSGS